MYGWPSAQDYLGFVSSSIVYDTILHIVSSVEGFYVISLSNFWSKNKNTIKSKNIKFILEKCSIEVETPTLYLMYNFSHGMILKLYLLLAIQITT